MLRALAKSSNGGLRGALCPSIFFALFFAFAWLIIDTRLIYHGGGIVTNFPVFFRGREFLNDFLSYPGGILDYAAAFASQFFSYSIAGAAVLTAQAWLIFVLTRYFLKKIGVANLAWIAFIPPVLILAGYSRYIYHFPSALALLVSLLFTCVYLKIRPSKPVPAFLAFLVLSVVCYVLTAGAFLVFAILSAVYELFFNRRRVLSAIFLLAAAPMPYGAALLFNIRPREAYTHLLGFFELVIFQYSGRPAAFIFYALYLIIPLTAILWGLYRTSKVSKSGPEKMPLPALAKMYVTASAITLTFATLLSIHDSRTKSLIAVDYYSAKGQWHKVLETAQTYPHHPYVMHAVDRALFHAGRLTEHMFRYPQDKHALLLTAEGLDAVNRRRFDVYLDIGAVNIGLYPLVEAMEKFGQHPYILKKLAIVHMAKGQTGAAKVYLHKLAKTLFDADWAEHYLKLIEEDSSLASAEQIQRLKNFIIDDDYCYLSLAEDRMFARLLEKNKNNRMAFEYRMAHLLLTGKLSDIIDNLPVMKSLEYRRIPPLLEQAILLHMSHTTPDVELHGYGLSVDSCNKFQNFGRIYSSYPTKEAAMAELAQKYGDTYFFYYAYGFSGAKE